MTQFSNKNEAGFRLVLNTAEALLPTAAALKNHVRLSDITLLF